MKNTSFESRINEALNLANEMDRRDFIKKTGRAGIGLATGGSPLSVAANIGANSLDLDPFAHISDEELIMDIPIKNWIDKIPSDRLKRMMNNDDGGFFKEWWKSLLGHIMIYNPNFVSNGKSEQGTVEDCIRTLKTMIDRYKKEDIDIEKLILKELSDPEGLSKIVSRFSKYNKHFNKNRNIHLGLGKTAKAIKVLESIGVKIPDFVKTSAARIEAKSLLDYKKYFEELESAEKMKKSKKPKDEPKRESKNYEPDLMHQPFESKLNQSLMKIFG